MSREARHANLRRALYPESICYIGGSFLEPAIAATRNLGFAGEVRVVNPRRQTIAGEPCLGSIGELETPPDVVFLAVNREMTNDLIAELDDMGAGGAVCYAAGYAETGGEGLALERELRQRAGNLAVIGPNCYGFNNFVSGALAMATPTLGERTARGCAFIGQSGNICINVANGRRGTPLSHVISCGNQAVLDFADYIEVLVDDPAVTSFALFMETLPDAAAFSRAAVRALEAGKPVIVLKSGVSRKGASMAMSHTASLAGDDRFYQALFDRLDIIRVETPEDLLETAKVVSVTGIPEGLRLAVMTCSGGDSGCVADIVEPLGIELPELDQRQHDDIARHMQAFTTIANPLDYNTSNWGRQDVLEDIFPVLLRQGIDAGLLVVDAIADAEQLPDTRSQDDGAAAAMRAFRTSVLRHGIPGVITSSLPDNTSIRLRRQFHEAGIAMTQGIRAGTLSLARTCLYGARRRAFLSRPAPGDRALAEPVPLAGEVRTLDEREGKQVLAAAGLTIPSGECVRPAAAVSAAERIGYPVVVKALSAAIAHKTEAGGVALDLADRHEVARAAGTIARNTGTRDLLVEAMVAGHVAEMIIGVTRDDTFGQVLIIGAGGTFVELVGDSVVLLLPLEREDVHRAIGSLKVSRLLDGYRGAPPGDVEALVDAVMAVAALAATHRASLVELDINPLLVMPQGGGAVVADCMMRMTGTET